MTQGVGTACWLAPEVTRVMNRSLYDFFHQHFHVSTHCGDYLILIVSSSEVIHGKL